MGIRQPDNALAISGAAIRRRHHTTGGRFTRVISTGRYYRRPRNIALVSRLRQGRIL